MKWFVLYTKPNCELKVTHQLNSLGINAFCPSYTSFKKYSDRNKKVKKPLMPRYVLVNLFEKDRNKVFEIPGIIKYLFWLGKPAEVRINEVEILQNELNMVEGSFKGDNKEVGGQVPGPAQSPPTPHKIIRVKEPSICNPLNKLKSISLTPKKSTKSSKQTKRYDDMMTY